VHQAVRSFVVALTLALTVPVVVRSSPIGQDPHLQHRGARVMGFDQDKTRHQFRLFKDGGAIQVSVKDPADAQNRDAIRAHLPHIAQLFGQGQFDAPMLVHDRQDVPGTKVMAERRAQIVWRFAETPLGGRVDIVTTDRAALGAVHEFLRFQISDHKTGDPVTVGKR
jgi:hypothetical protein